MKNHRKLGDMIKHPGGVFTVLFTVFTVLVVAAALALGITSILPPPVAYVLYAVSALSLAYTVYLLITNFGRAKKSVVQKLETNRITKKLMDDVRLRAVVFACGSMAINIAYVGFNGVVAIVSHSVWYGALAGYYLLLTLLRSSVVYSHIKSAVKKSDESAQETTEQRQIKKYKLYRACGIVLMLTVLALSFAITQNVRYAQSFRYAGLMIYAAAAYTFTKCTIAVVNFVKAKKRKEITVETIRNISLADAAVSLLALQMAMFQAFGGEFENPAVANAVTGAAVCLLIFVIGILMIVKAHKSIKKIKETVQ